MKNTIAGVVLTMTLAVSALIFGGAVYAQPGHVGAGDRGGPAGGNWTYFAMKDKLTDQLSGAFVLVANEDVGVGLLRGRPEFSLLCAKGKFKGAGFYVPVTVAAERSLDFLLRTDGKIRPISVTVGDDFRNMIIVDSLLYHSTNNFLKAQDARLQFPVYGGGIETASFSPAGLDKTKVATACGESFANRIK